MTVIGPVGPTAILLLWVSKLCNAEQVQKAKGCAPAPSVGSWVGPDGSPIHAAVRNGPHSFASGEKRGVGQRGFVTAKPHQLPVFLTMNIFSNTSCGGVK